MELQLLVILVVALLVFGPERMLEFATQMGRFVRKMRQEWAQIQMELQMQELKKKLEMDTKEGEEKVKKYLFGETPPQPVSQTEFLKGNDNTGGEQSGNTRQVNGATPSAGVKIPTATEVENPMNPGGVDSQKTPADGKNKPSPEGVNPASLSIEDLVAGRAPVVEDLNQPENPSGDRNTKTSKGSDEVSKNPAGEVDTAKTRGVNKGGEV
jgi:sec-independent protein translocase protein TatB